MSWNVSESHLGSQSTCLRAAYKRYASFLRASSFTLESQPCEVRLLKHCDWQLKTRTSMKVKSVNQTFVIRSPLPERLVRSWPLVPYVVFQSRPDPWPQCGRAGPSPHSPLWWTAGPWGLTPALCFLSASHLRLRQTSGFPEQETGFRCCQICYNFV